MSASAWMTSRLKRVTDLMLASLLLLVCSPLLLLSVIAIKLTSRGPVLFRQTRVGRLGECFEILKLRTMRVRKERTDAPCVTAAADTRITGVGRLLRRFKIDELPQLWNVVRGDMSLVGPRPLVPQQDPPLFICRPGLTGAGSLAFRNQELSLAHVAPELLPRIHAQVLVPARFATDRRYHQHATFTGDLRLIAQTALVVSRLAASTPHDVNVGAMVAAFLQRDAAKPSSAAPAVSAATAGRYFREL